MLIRQVIDWFFQILYICIIINAVLSWLPVSRDNPLAKLVGLVVEPILNPIRKLLARSPLGGTGMPVDFSPIIAFFLLNVIRNILHSIL
ncbi:MAG: YggT family protein [Clostridiales bacterium]|jgi:YggT family protein|nr:YggT family protein [Clostridiales bacterium]